MCLSTTRVDVPDVPSATPSVAAALANPDAAVAHSTAEPNAEAAMAEASAEARAPAEARAAAENAAANAGATAVVESRKGCGYIAAAEAAAEAEKAKATAAIAEAAEAHKALASMKGHADAAAKRAAAAEKAVADIEKDASAALQAALADARAELEKCQAKAQAAEADAAEQRKLAAVAEAEKAKAKEQAAEAERAMGQAMAQAMAQAAEKAKAREQAAEAEKAKAHAMAQAAEAKRAMEQAAAQAAAQGTAQATVYQAVRTALEDAAQPTITKLTNSLASTSCDEIAKAMKSAKRLRTLAPKLSGFIEEALTRATDHLQAVSSSVNVQPTTQRIVVGEQTDGGAVRLNGGYTLHEAQMGLHSGGGNLSDEDLEPLRSFLTKGCGKHSYHPNIVNPIITQRDTSISVNIIGQPGRGTLVPSCKVDAFYVKHGPSASVVAACVLLSHQTRPTTALNQSNAKVVIAMLNVHENHQGVGLARALIWRAGKLACDRNAQNLVALSTHHKFWQSTLQRPAWGMDEAWTPGARSQPSGIWSTSTRIAVPSPFCVDNLKLFVLQLTSPAPAKLVTACRERGIHSSPQEDSARACVDGLLRDGISNIGKKKQHANAQRLLVQVRRPEVVS